MAAEVIDARRASSEVDIHRTEPVGIYPRDGMHFYRGVIEQNRERCAYWAHAPKLPGLFAEAGTVAELTGGLGDALKGYLDGMFPDGVIPEGDLTLDDPIVSLEIEHNRERIWLCLNVARGVELSLSAAPERPEVRYWKACENCQQRPVTEVMPRTPGGLPEIRGGDQTELRVLLCRTCWFDIAG